MQCDLKLIVFILTVSFCLSVVSKTILRCEIILVHQRRYVFQLWVHLNIQFL